MDKKPNVFPTNTGGVPQTNTEKKLTPEEFEQEKIKVANEIYESTKNESDVTPTHLSAVEMMRLRTEAQLAQRNQYGVVVDQSLAEVTPNKNKTVIQDYAEQNKDRNDEQIRLRDEQLAKNLEMTRKYNEMSEQSMNNMNQYKKPEQVMENTQQTQNYNTQQQTYSSPAVQQTTQQTYQNYGQAPSNIDPYILELSQPNYNAPFDVIPLPSMGKLYRNKKPSIKVAYMTTSDENILSSPNLLKSGQFLEILLNRKILEPELRYKDLLPGDRNAIMIWLRATAYGEMYPVTLLDENDEAFDTEIDLNTLKTKELGAEPDDEGLFNFLLPVSKKTVKFKFLNCGEIDELEKLIEKEKEENVPVNNLNTYKFERMIVEIDGIRDKNMIKDFANSMRIPDAKALDNYIDKIECNIDLEITVRTPGDGSITTFLPLNLGFFWPDIRI